MTHLTEEQLDDFLIGDASAQSLDHLAVCADCRARASAFSSTVADFNEASFGWAEARSNSISRDILAARPHAAAHRLLPVTTGLVVAATVAFGVHLAAGRVDHAPRAVTIAVSGQAAALAKAPDLASDNALLANINSALDQPDSSPLAAYQQSTRPALSANSHLAEN